MVSGNETKKSKMQTQVDMCGLILGIWERLGDGTMAPKLKRLHRGEILEDAPFCAQGVNHEYATAVMREGYHPNMTIAEGVALLVKAIQAAFEADKLIILGGYIEVLVVGFRDIYGLPMSRGEQMLDRAFTCYRVKKFRKRGARKPVKAPYKRRRLILHDSDDEL
ncbi:hypothetical protein MKX03_037145 [Papaver bracteatum]|nr:hypothetical protein MKX03_037145 [Papaver bracteatum]